MCLQKDVHTDIFLLVHIQRLDIPPLVEVYISDESKKERSLLQVVYSIRYFLVTLKYQEV